MNILVTGATGFVGRRAVQALNARGHHLFLLSRYMNQSSKTRNLGEIIQWDWKKEALPINKFPDLDGVLNLAGEPVFPGRWTAKKKTQILDSRVNLTKSLLSALAPISKTRNLTIVSASAIGIYPENLDVTIDETSGFGSGFLANICKAWEKAVTTAPLETSRQCILRIGVVLGREGGVLKNVLPVFKLGLGGPLGNGRQIMSWIHVSDLVNIILKCFEDTSYSGVFNAVSPTAITNSEFTKSLAKALKRPAIFPVPSIALKLALGEGSHVVLGSQKITPKRLLEKGFNFQYLEIEEALKLELSTDPLYS